jgi:hypothetical protein
VLSAEMMMVAVAKGYFRFLKVLLCGIWDSGFFDVLSFDSFSISCKCIVEYDNQILRI